MSHVVFCTVGMNGASEGMVAIETAEDFLFAIFYSAEQGMEILREAHVSPEELAYWGSLLADGHYRGDNTRQAIRFWGSAASLVGLLLSRLNGQAIPLPTDRTGQPKMLTLFRMPQPGTAATDGFMAIRGEEDHFYVFWSRIQAIELLQRNRSWLPAEAVTLHRREAEASPLPATTKKSIVHITGYPAWLINEVLQRYEAARIRHEAERTAHN